MKKKPYSTEQIFGAIAEACKLLGWSISFAKKAKHVNYLIMGKPKIVDELLSRLECKKNATMHCEKSAFERRTNNEKEKEG